MRGGKREGAGRKGFGETKIYRLPVELEPEIMALLAKHKAKVKPEQTNIDSVTQSKPPIRPKFPILNKTQIKLMKDWLLRNGFAKSTTEARKMTESPKLCYDSFHKYIHIGDEHTNNPISEICELYAIN
jgi:hypothetical protein